METESLCSTLFRRIKHSYTCCKKLFKKRRDSKQNKREGERKRFRRIIYIKTVFKELIGSRKRAILYRPNLEEKLQILIGAIQQSINLRQKHNLYM